MTTKLKKLVQMGQCIILATPLMRNSDKVWSYLYSSFHIFQSWLIHNILYIYHSLLMFVSDNSYLFIYIHFYIYLFLSIPVPDIHLLCLFYFGLILYSYFVTCIFSTTVTNHLAQLPTLYTY